MMTADREDPHGVVCMSGWVQGPAGYGGDYWTVIVTSNRQFYYTQTENIRNFE
jgi:hypothetical protein